MIDDRVEELRCATERLEDLVIELRYQRYRESSEAEAKRIIEKSKP